MSVNESLNYRPGLFGHADDGLFVRGIGKSYKGRNVVRDFSIHVQRGEVVGAHAREPAAVAADRGAHGIANVGVGHGRVS